MKEKEHIHPRRKSCQLRRRENKVPARATVKTADKAVPCKWFRSKFAHRNKYSPECRRKACPVMLKEKALDKAVPCKWFHSKFAHRNKYSPEYRRKARAGRVIPKEIRMGIPTVTVKDCHPEEESSTRLEFRD